MFYLAQRSHGRPSARGPAIDAPARHGASAGQRLAEPSDPHHRAGPAGWRQRLPGAIVGDAALVREKFTPLGFDPLTSTPAQFMDMMKNELALWAKVARDAGIKPE
ncbi:MAG: hypothetical protein EXR27_03295 [Betaproteobacteria bacterium]|nr:hypothetical protein [Betaproteobacteria bacterium]